MMVLCVCVTDVDSVLLRMTIIGVLLSFRSLAQEALNDVRIVIHCQASHFAIQVTLLPINKHLTVIEV